MSKIKKAKKISLSNKTIIASKGRRKKKVISGQNFAKVQQEDKFLSKNRKLNVADFFSSDKEDAKQQLLGDKMPRQITIANESDWSKFIRDRRKILKLGQKRLGDFANLSQHAISNLENGRIKTMKMNTLFKLQRYLGFKIILELEY